MSDLLPRHWRRAASSPSPSRASPKWDAALQRLRTVIDQATLATLRVALLAVAVALGATLIQHGTSMLEEMVGAVPPSAPPAGPVIGR